MTNQPTVNETNLITQAYATDLWRMFGATDRPTMGCTTWITFEVSLYNLPKSFLINSLGAAYSAIDQATSVDQLADLAPAIERLPNEALPQGYLSQRAAASHYFVRKMKALRAKQR